MKKYRLRVKSFVKQSILTLTFFPQHFDLFIHYSKVLYMDT